jgi:hypothetical protein
MVLRPVSRDLPLEAAGVVVMDPELEINRHKEEPDLGTYDAPEGKAERLAEYDPFHEEEK